MARQTFVLLVSFAMAGCGPGSSPEPSASQQSEPASSHAADPNPISRSEFRDHLLDLLSRATPILSRMSDAITPMDETALSAAAADLYDLMKADEKWQIANEERILGNCYDDAAASYSNGVVFTTGAAVQFEEYLRTKKLDTLSYASSLLADGAREFDVSRTALDALDC
jgi:hypothetical protein